MNIPRWSTVSPLMLASLITVLPLTTQAQHGDRPGVDMEDPPSDLPIPPAPHLSVKEALAVMQVEKGFSVACSLAEPDIVDPVQMVFDEDGRMWVVEMRGYMPDITGKGEDAPIGRVSVHEDSDGDGVYDKHSVFMDKLVLPRAVAVVPGGMLISEHSALLFVPRIGGRASGPAQLVDPAYASDGNVEHRACGLLYGLDNAWHSTISGRAYQYRGGQWSWIADEKRGQFGISQDNFGRLLSNGNSLPASLDLMPPGLLARNQALNGSVPDVHTDNRVFPIRINPGVNRGYARPGEPENVLDVNWRLRQATATCGPLYYRGDLAVFGKSLIVPEPAGNLVMRYAVNDLKGSVKFSHEDHAFVASTDERFRPVNTTLGPDGCVYLVDMDRGILQHQFYATSYLRRQIKARNLEDEGPAGWGRIWRVAPTGHAAPVRRPQMSKQGAEELVPYLADANAWWRETAQRVLVGRHDVKVVPLLEKMAITHANPVARAHALWTLDGMGAIKFETLRAAATEDEDLRITCCQLLSRLTVMDVIPAARGLLLEWARSENRRYPRAAIAFAEGVLAASMQQAPEKDILLWAKDEVVRRYLLAGLAGQESLAAASAPSELAQAITKVQAERSKIIAGQIKKNPSWTMPKPGAAEMLTLQPWNGPVAVQWRKGEQAYSEICGACHGAEGAGATNVAPPLAGSQWVHGSRKRLITAVLNGVTGPIVVGDELAVLPEGVQMPGFLDNPAMDDQKLAEILSYIRSSWGHAASEVTADQVKMVRAELGGRPRAMTAAEILNVEPWPDDEVVRTGATKPGAPGIGFFQTDGGRVSLILLVVLIILLGPPILAISWRRS